MITKRRVACELDQLVTHIRLEKEGMFQAIDDELTAATDGVNCRIERDTESRRMLVEKTDDATTLLDKDQIEFLKVGFYQIELIKYMNTLHVKLYV
jgi:hypothetical protein